METSHLGIKTLLIEPGRFRTKLLSSGNMKTVEPAHAEYADMAKTLLKHLAEEDQAQDGDPNKLVNIVLDLVRQEGVASGKKIPLRLPIGADVCDDAKARYHENLKVLEDWGPVVYGTSYEN